ncbi:MAG: hypothetical protein H6R35_258 [Bacteroidetes bacterium]|nr:hypothetical protein [Bacteroidota bacterium]
MAGLYPFFEIIIRKGSIKDIFTADPVFPQKTDPGIWSVKKEVYAPSPEPRTGISLSMNYIGSGLKREETRAIIRSSDWTEKPRRRISEDNGRTWSDWVIIDEGSKVQGDFTQSGGEDQGGTGPYDPVSGRLIKPVFQRIIKGIPQIAMSEIWKGNRLFCDHGFYQLSEDDGRSWGKAYMLKYEEGPGFNNENWGDEKFFRTNEMYIGNAVVIKNGSVIITATVPVPFIDEEDKNIPSVFPNNYREGCVAGAVCFVGRWNETVGNYDWRHSNKIFLPGRVSTRGLVELNISELSSGKLLMIMRGSNTGLDPLKYPGRRWFSVSDDGGLTWGEIKDMRYDSGEQLYSPASISSTLRSSVNNKLYWIGNISDQPVNGNSPRYPLVIVEIDEDRISFRKDTLTIIDDREPEHDSESLQLSNFSIFENRETNEIEIYLLRLGENGGGLDIWTADAYKYTLRLKS